MDSVTNLWLAVTALVAALINGAVGYGFSSVLTPIAIFWYSNKVLNPALVIVEVAVNVTLLIRERRHIRATWSRANPVITTLLPGVVLGTIGLTVLAVNDVKLIVYAVLLPLAILQLYGIRRPFQNERRGGLAVGPGIGFLYALTTISGPPLAIFLRNQGLSKEEFRCTIAQIRVGESTLTLGTYIAFSYFFQAGLVSLPSLALLPYLVVPVLVGVPLGALLMHAVSREFFSRFIMGVDGLLVSYGLARTLISLKYLSMSAGMLLVVLLFAGVGLLTYWALRKIPVRRPAPPADGTVDLEALGAGPPAALVTAPPSEGPPT